MAGVIAGALGAVKSSSLLQRGVGAAIGIAKRPPLLGATVGGTYGAFRGDSTGDNRLENIMKGAMGGAMVGAAGKLAFRSGAKTGFSSFARKGSDIAKGAAKVGKLALGNPGTALGITAAGIGGYAFLNSDRSPASSQGFMANVNYDTQAAAASEMRMGNIPQSAFVGNAAENSAYSAAQNRMRQSTSGLVRGLHRGRHG